MSLRGHYTQVRFGPQVALPHRFARPIHRMYSKWYKPLVVQPKFTCRGKHSLASSHLHQARTPPLDFGRRRGTVSFEPALPTGAGFQGTTPWLRPSKYLLKGYSIPLVPPSCTMGARVKRGALPREHQRPDQRPPLKGYSYSGGSIEVSSPATAMARTSRGVQIVRRVVGSCAHWSRSALGRGIGWSFDLSMKTERRSPD